MKKALALTLALTLATTSVAYASPNRALIEKQVKETKNKQELELKKETKEQEKEIKKQEKEIKKETKKQEKENKKSDLENISPEALLLQQKGVLKGNGKGLELDKPLSRVEGSIVLKRLLDLKSTEVQTDCIKGEIYKTYEEALQEEPEESKSTCSIKPPKRIKIHPVWDDVPGWAVKDVEELGSMGLIKGQTQYKFHPHDAMTAEQFTTIILRVLEYTDEGENPDFTWDKSLEKAVEIKLLTPEQKLKIEEDKMFTREEMSIIAYNYMQLIQDKPEIVEQEDTTEEDIVEELEEDPAEELETDTENNIED